MVCLLLFGQKFDLLPFLLLLYSLALAANNKLSVSKKGKIVAENSPSAAVHKFIYNNEQICGDMFGHKGWLPAHKKCEIQCITGVHICQMPEKPEGRTSPQRCLLLPQECQERLKLVLRDFNLSNSTNFSAGSPPSIRPLGLRRTFTSSLPAQQSSPEVVGPPSSHSILPPAIPVPMPPSPAGLPPSIPTPAAPNDHFLVPLSTDGVLLPLPNIVLSSSTFTPLGPPSWRTGGKSRQKQTLSPIGPPTTTTWPPETTPKVDDTLQQNYENMFVEKALPVFTTTFTTTESMNIFDTKSNPFDVDTSESEKEAGVEAAESRSEEPRSPYGSDEGYSFERHNSVISPPSLTMYNVPAKVTEQSEEGGSHVHIFGPPYSPTKSSMLLNPTSPAPTNIVSNEVKELVRKSKAHPKKKNAAMAIQRAASTVEQIDLSTELNTKHKNEKPEKPWWTWRQVASKLKNKPFYVQESGVVLDRSVRCCEWALNGLCDRSWQRIRQLCPKSCGTVVCSSADGALSCNRMIDVDVIDCYEKRRRSKVFGATNFSFHNETSESSSRERFQLLQSPAPPSLPASKESAASKAFSKLVDENNFLKAFAVEDEIKRFNQLNSNQNFRRNV